MTVHHSWHYNQFSSPGLFILRCPPTSSFVCLVFPILLSLSDPRWFWPDLMSRNDGHSTVVCLPLQSSGVNLPRPIACWELAHTSLRCEVSCRKTSFPRFVFLCGALQWWAMIHQHTGRWMWQERSWSWGEYSCQSKLLPALHHANYNFPGVPIQTGFIS